MRISELSYGNRNLSHLCASSGHFPLILLSGSFPGLEEFPCRHALVITQLCTQGRPSVTPQSSLWAAFSSLVLYPENLKCVGFLGLPVLFLQLLKFPGLYLASHSLSCGWKLGHSLDDSLGLCYSCDLELPVSASLLDCLFPGPPVFLFLGLLPFLLKYIFQ